MLQALGTAVGFVLGVGGFVLGIVLIIAGMLASSTVAMYGFIIAGIFVIGLGIGLARWLSGANR